jgi:hypothetical protein
MELATAELTGDLRRGLDDAGYVVIPGVVAKEPLAELADDLHRAYAQAPKFPGGGSISGHLNCFPGPGSRFIYEALVDAGIVAAVHALRPNLSNDIRATMNYNLPGSVAQHYHMDGLYTEDFIICNVAVVDTTIENGAIDVLPTTNQEFLPFWKFAVQRTARGSTRVEMAQGDLLVRRSTLWHRGMPNRTKVARPMMSVTFGERSAPAGPPLAAFDGPVTFYPNWFSTSRVGVMRERAYCAAPITYSAYRFVKSLHGQHGYSSY